MPSARPRPADIDDVSLAADDDLVLQDDSLAIASDEESELPPLPTVAESEAEAVALVDGVVHHFRSGDREQDQRFDDATDSEYWIAVCFQTREQKEDFLLKANWLNLGQKYLDGMACARALGITLESRIPPLRSYSIDTGYARLAQHDAPATSDVTD